ncbi:unnamed protein product [Paramecium sonneborni]|uniref:Phosphodiesterase n=1 Tax=Paramecium sonneborni TaxID=65129 RepID=A0A8S1NPE8_9CILI|nr:unnamed protein product [Paramecium sonneborni]
MSYLAQSSRLTALLISLKNKKLITPDQYTRLCDYAINDNPELKALFMDYEKGLSQNDFLSGVSIILNNKNGSEHIIKSYFESVVSINSQLKENIKEFYRDIKTNMNEIYEECFKAQHHLQEIKDLIKLVLKQFYVEEFYLIQFEEGHQCVILTNNFDFRFFKEEYKISSWAHKQNAHQLNNTQTEHYSLLKTHNLPKQYIISQHAVLFLTFSDNVNKTYSQFFMATFLYDKFITLIYQGYQIIGLTKLQSVRTEILQLVSRTIELYNYKLMFQILVQIMQQFNLQNLLCQFEKELTKQQTISNYLLILLSSDLDIIGIELEGNLSQQLVNKVKSTFKKSIKKYKKKLKLKKDLLESFQQVTQHNEMIMCLFFNNFLNLYYMTVQWNHDQFVQKYSLPKEIHYADPIYKIFDKNPIIIQKVKEIIDSQKDHLEFNDGFFKFSLKIERGFKKQIKQISIFLFNIQVKRPLAELFRIFRNKVKILLTIRKATLAFKSKQLMLENQFLRQSALVMYLPDQDRRRITQTANQDHDQDLEKYRNYTMKQATKKIQSFLNKYDEEDVKNPELRRIAVDPNLQQKLLDYEFNLLNKKMYKNKYIIAFNLFQMCEYTKQFPLLNKEFINFMTVLKYKYNKKSNPFHNFTHGVNVMHGCFLFGHHQKFGSYFSDLQRYAMTFAGLCHDVDHSGTTNLFQVNAQTKLALLYNDKSVLENHHVAVTYKILAQKSCDFFGQIPKTDRITIRKYVVNNILATDNQYHFNLLNDIEIRFGQSKGDIKIFETEENKLLLSGFLTHAADFFGAAKQYQVARAWSERLRKEFQAQSQLEDIIGIAQTPYLRNLDNEVQYAKNEAGFLKVIVKPIYESLNNYSDGALQLQVANINLSIKKYEEIIESANQ